MKTKLEAIATRIRQTFCRHKFRLSVQWPCAKCGKVFYAHCGLDVLSRHGEILLGIAVLLIVLAVLCADGSGILTTLTPTKRPFQIIAPPTHPVKLIIIPAGVGPMPDGYRIRWGGKSGVYTNSFDAGNMSPVSVPNLINGRQYFFAVEAYNYAGDTSALSPETNAVVTFKDVYEIVLTPLDSATGTTPYGAYPQTSMLYTNSLPSVYVTYNVRVLPKP